MSQFLVLKAFLSYVYLETCILLRSPQRLTSFLHIVDFMIMQSCVVQLAGSHYFQHVGMADISSLRVGHEFQSRLCHSPAV